VSEVREPKLPSRLSPSAADTFEGCPKKWWGKYVCRVSDPPGPAAELGTLVHAALEDLYQSPSEVRSRAAARKFLRERGEKMIEEGSFADVDDFSAFFREAWTRLLTIWKVEEPAKVDVVATEQKLHTEVGGVPFTGYIDRLERIDGVVVVDDYKTGKRPSPQYAEPKNRQLQLYAIATNNAMPELNVQGARLIWLNSNGAIWNVDCSPEALDRTTSYFQNVWTELAASVQTNTWEEKPGPLCGWCPVLPMCDSGKAEVRWRANEGKLKETAPAWNIEEQWR